jgi:two-component system, sensor histidine kinase and response regulator
VTQAEKSTIMLVDDQPANLKLLEEMLKEDMYSVCSFPRGRLALAAAAQHRPDLILLDINMPEMNGFEFCELLKSNPELARIPVIFLSALNETEDKVKAFRCGGVDYVTKPFQFEEVKSRVATHLKLHRLQQAMELHNEHLEDLVRDRTRELEEAHERLKVLDRSKTDFLHLISHELRTPLNGLLGIGELALEGADSELRELYDQSRRRMVAILEHALLLTQIEVEGEKFTGGCASLSTVLQEAIAQAVGFARSRSVFLKLAPIQAACIFGREDLLVKAFQGLVETAVKFSGQAEAVEVAGLPSNDEVRVEIKSRGHSIPPAAIPKFFEVFSIGEEIIPGWDSGLQASLAHRILKLFGGTVSVENREPSGILITVIARRAPRPRGTNCELGRADAERRSAIQ